MPHFRKRLALKPLNNLLAQSAIVGVFGHRQVGKTTFVEKLCQKYFSLDDEETYLRVESSAKNFLNEIYGPLVALDECQKAPTLFPALKELVRIKPKLGRFLLSGSVRFTSRKAIQESLTGRIMQMELLPLLFSELHEVPPVENIQRFLMLNHFQPNLDTSKYAKAEFESRSKMISSYMNLGGLPGVCFTRNDKARNQKIMSQLETILDRDVRMVYSTSLSYPTIKKVLSALAERASEPFKYSEITQATGVSARNLQHLFYAFESVFILRPLALEGDSTGELYYFEDPSEWRSLRTQTVSEESELGYFCLLQARAQFHYSLGENYSLFQFRTRAGTLVPVAIRNQHKILGFIPTSENIPNRKERAAARSFLSRYATAKVLFVSSQNVGLQCLDERSLICSKVHLTD